MPSRFRTDFIPSSIVPKLKPKSKILLLGSCFSDHIGRKLKESKFKVLANPLGNIFNPISLAKIISHYLQGDKNIQVRDLWCKDGVISHKDFHSVHNSLDSLTYVRNIQSVLNVTRNQLSESSHIILTFGSSWGYREKKSEEVVTNCHKMDPALFDKELFSVQQMALSLTPIFAMKKVNFILTVSPVRHLKDGIIENMRSKARLIELCHSLVDNNSNCSYFPAYELMIDDLRDYRFYKEDMIHPSSVAIDYIWDKFKQAIFSEEAEHFAIKNNKLNKAKRHRPFLTNSEVFRQFCIQQLEKIRKLESEYPYIDYQNETNYFTQYLK
jgi:hypothetical protein